MSYVALATDSFAAVTHFYGVELGLPVVAAWDRPGARGARFDLGGGLRLEILDNARESRPRQLSAPGERTHLVIEVDDIQAARDRLTLAAPLPQKMPWGATLFQIHDPDGIPVTFLQWDQPPA